MTITWPTAATTICHGATRTPGEAAGPGNLSTDVQPGLIPRNYVGGGGPVHESTGNDAVSVSFTTVTTFATPALAAAHVLTLAATTRIGTLAISGSITLSGAGLNRIQPRANGCSVTCSYDFTGHITTP